MALAVSILTEAIRSVTLHTPALNNALTELGIDHVRRLFPTLP
jgi:hypothetical protein